MKQLNEQENKQVEIGVAAAKLMADPFFGYVMSELGNAYVSEMMRTKPEQSAEREGFYHAIKALQDVGANLTHWVQVKDTIMANLAAAEQESEVPDEE